MPNFIVFRGLEYVCILLYNIIWPIYSFGIMFQVRYSKSSFRNIQKREKGLKSGEKRVEKGHVQAGCQGLFFVICSL